MNVNSSARRPTRQLLAERSEYVSMTQTRARRPRKGPLQRRHKKFGSHFGVIRGTYEARLGFHVAQTLAPRGTGPRSVSWSKKIVFYPAREREWTWDNTRVRMDLGQQRRHTKNHFGGLPAPLAHAQARGVRPTIPQRPLACVPRTTPVVRRETPRLFFVDLGTTGTCLVEKFAGVFVSLI